MRSFIYPSTAFAMAFASMADEILLAQCTTVLYGGTVLRYSTVIGLFVFSLGMGAAFWAWSDREPSTKTFWSLELLLACLGLTLPVLVFPADRLASTLGLQSPLGPDMPLGYIVALTLAVAIGWLAGMELPVLLLAGKNPLRSESQNLQWTQRMVGLDFMGTVAATMVVPVFLYPGLGIVGTAALASGLNALVGWWACEEQGPRVLPLKCLTTFLIAWALVAFIWREDISLWLAAQAF